MSCCVPLRTHATNSWTRKKRISTRSSARRRSSTKTIRRRGGSERTATKCAKGIGGTARPKSGRRSVADHIAGEAGSERVADTVRQALLLVGPAEGGLERVVGEPPADEPAV